MTVPYLHTRLTTDHFRDGQVPELRKLRDWLSGDGLSWELVEAVADVCFPDEPVEDTERRLAPARTLWRVAQERPATTESAEVHRATTHDVLVAQDRAIEAYRELDRARQAYQVSEHGRHQALQAATIVFALLGQAQAKIAELTRRLDALQSGPLAAPGELGRVQQRLERAKDQETELRLQLTRAEQERDAAQQVADHAARRINVLESELVALRSRITPDQDAETEQPGAGMDGLPTLHIADIDDATMDDVDRTLDRVRQVLAQEHEAVQEAAEDIGWRILSGHGDGQGPASNVISGQVVTAMDTGVHAERPRDSELFQTTPDNPPASKDSPGAALPLLGVEKAVLYDREASIRDSLQREMLPDSLPSPTGVQLAFRYVPAAESARLGGDWYDAIPLPGQRLGLMVGDVMGHSMTSAAIMGQLRTTVQTLSGLDLSPQEVLYHLDEQAQRLGRDRMATCIYAVYDPIAHRVTIANAGHPPPVLLHANGVAEVLRVPPGAPIGVGGVPFEAVELAAPAGATLLLYTDGLVESRSRDVWGGIEMLRERLQTASAVVCPPPLEPLCDEVLEIVGPGDRDDDIALLAARFDGISPSDVAYWFLEPRPQTVGRARRLVREALSRWNLESMAEATELLVSEVVTNAVRYAERPITLRLLRTDVLRCEVGDDAPTLPRMRYAQPQDEDGRGLYIVNRVAQRWGATRLSAGKVIWFELPLP